MRHLLALTLLFAPLALHAQTASIAPGMNKSQVVAAFGEPVTVRTASEFTYLFYRNECGKACGMNDLVVLRRDSVVDAILRSPHRKYTGVSSSPEPLSRSAARTRPAKPVAKKPAAVEKPAPAAKPAPATTTAPAKMKPGQPNDTRPSIPAGEPPLKKAPATAPATPPSTKPKTP